MTHALCRLAWVRAWPDWDCCCHPTTNSPEARPGERQPAGAPSCCLDRLWPATPPPGGPVAHLAPPVRRRAADGCCRGTPDSARAGGCCTTCTGLPRTCPTPNYAPSHTQLCRSRRATKSARDLTSAADGAFIEWRQPIAQEPGTQANVPARSGRDDHCAVRTGSTTLIVAALSCTDARVVIPKRLGRCLQLHTRLLQPPDLRTHAAPARHGGRLPRRGRRTEREILVRPADGDYSRGRAPRRTRPALPAYASLRYSAPRSLQPSPGGCRSATPTATKSSDWPRAATLLPAPALAAPPRPYEPTAHHRPPTQPSAHGECHRRRTASCLHLRGPAAFAHSAHAQAILAQQTTRNRVLEARLRHDETLRAGQAESKSH
ncbi:hypothetical protein SAMN04488000_11823 [Lentzea albida]|uniref:Uncharacterized protein n=1 Tax=Lentzea albida TaxID=65499 RepID=A0A1H9VCV3_9PSEU|nr:hypothetical protein SAMN04488000_11823 [Lentzea albida]